MIENDILFQKRLKDLSRMAYYRDIPMYTDFLDMHELHMVHTFFPEEENMKLFFFGGYEEAERQMAAFIPDALSFDKDTEKEQYANYPIVCLKISPCSMKFGEELSHRDYLGALIHLGIERNKLGDILIKEKEAFLFCHEQLVEFLIQNLVKIRHTNVKIVQITDPQELPKPRLEPIHGTVASIRLDSMIALAFRSSRSGMLGLIEGGKVYVNGKLATSNGHPLKDGDVVSVRGYGKFRFEGGVTTTKKGRCSVTVYRYV